VEAGRVRVEDAHGAAPSIPFWRGEAPGRTEELSREVSRLRDDIAARPRAEAIEFLMRECALDVRGAEQATDYVLAGKASLGAMPTHSTVVAERFFDESGGMQLVLHAPFGARINRAWGLALRKRFCRSFNFELQAAATDNGIVISLSEQHSFPLDIVFGFLKSATVEGVLTQALLDAPMFTARWRWNITRALAVLRFRGGIKIPAPIQRMRSDDLLAAVFPDQAACGENLVGEIRIPDHPLVNETIANCLHEAMDLDGLKRVLDGFADGTIRTVAVETPEASPFSHEILNANPYAYLDDAPLEERRARAVQMRRTLPDLAEGVGALDAAAIEQVASESWPDVRDADELHDALLTLITLPPVPEWEHWFDELAATRRVITIRDGSAVLWAAAERTGMAHAAHSGTGDEQQTAVTEILRGWLESSGPITAAELAERLALLRELVDAGLARLETEGQILRGRFSPRREAGEVEWCNRRVLARIHRLTIGRLRREIEPVSTADFIRFLFRWQHLAPGSQLHGLDGAVHVLRQLQGYEMSAAAWESQILPRRIARYSPDLLDQLCLSGEVMWGRLSPHPAFERPEPGRVRPTRVAPITIFLREDSGWLLAAAHHEFASVEESLSHAAREVLARLRQHGASFFPDLTRTTGRLSSEVEDALWELVAAGLVSADGFENLRSLVDPKRRRGEGRGRNARPRHAAGRWALLRTDGEHTLPSNEAFANQLLLRWGVIFRDLLARETLAPPWRDLLVVLRKLEARGEIRGGRFVGGPIGEQFARPEAIELLRAMRRSDDAPNSVSVAAADPLNLAGIILPGPRVSALTGEAVELIGAPELVASGM
jgi:ATP-dependent helicase Lhr and Lhr-like helicase